MAPKPVDTKLYNKVKAEAKKKFDVWPSIYASSWLVREYKKRGGKYKGKRDASQGLERWYTEKWIDVCKLPKKVKCGRPKGGFKDYAKKYPYCRPSVRVNSRTPKTAGELTKAQKKKLCAKKRKSPKKRMKSA